MESSSSSNPFARSKSQMGEDVEENKVPDSDEEETEEITFEDDATFDLVEDEEKDRNFTQAYDQVAEELIPADLVPVSKRTNEYAEALSKSYIDLAELVYERECSVRSKVLTNYSQEQFVSHCIKILWYTHPLLLKELACGNYSKTLINSAPTAQLRKLHAAYSQHGDGQPSIYMQQLVNNAGESPTPNELQNIIALARGYSDRTLSRSIVRAIDSAIYRGEDTWKHPYPRYLEPKRPSAAKTIKKFCDYLEKRLKPLIEEAGQGDTPLTYPLVEFGYSKNSKTRLMQHRTHNSSNYIMNLFEAICLYQEIGYQMHQYIIYFCFEPDQVYVAEALFTRIGLGYIERGTGFSHHPAGQNCHGSVKEQRLWDKWFAEAIKSKQFITNHERDVKLAEKYDGMEKKLLGIVQEKSETLIFLKALLYDMETKRAEALEKEIARKKKIVQDLRALLEML
jgi:hypothetical protein